MSNWIMPPALYAQESIFTLFFKKKYWVSVELQGFFRPSYLVMGNVSVPSISLEVLEYLPIKIAIFIAIFNCIYFQFQTKGELSISEGATTGTRKLLEPSILPGRNLDAPLSIIDGNEGSFFSLHVSRSQDGRRVSYVHLETRKKLDREITPNFKLNITNGKGYLDLRVDILDINDNPPVFDKSEYKVNVNDSVAIGTVHQIVSPISNSEFTKIFRRRFLMIFFSVCQLKKKS